MTTKPKTRPSTNAPTVKKNEPSEGVTSDARLLEMMQEIMEEDAVKAGTVATAKPEQTLVITKTFQGETAAQATARAFMQPSVLAGCMLAEMSKAHPGIDVNAFVAELETQAKAVSAGSLARPEEILTAQAHSLDALFYSLANRSRGNIDAGYLEAGERYMKLAMRAQNQCRATLETLPTSRIRPRLPSSSKRTFQRDISR